MIEWSLRSRAHVVPAAADSAVVVIRGDAPLQVAPASEPLEVDLSETSAVLKIREPLKARRSRRQDGKG